MTVIAAKILEEIDSLDKEELQLVYDKIKERIRRQKRMEEALTAFIGFGKGVWKEDAQEYVTKLRSEERAF